jgi:hypothetical protein
MLPLLTEHGFLPVPPVIHHARLEDLPGCFGSKPKRRELWESFLLFAKWLTLNTPVRKLYMDGRFLSSSDDVYEIEVGIELTIDLIRKCPLPTFNIPASEEFSVRIRYFAPHRPEKYNFHEEFQTPDPEVRLQDARPSMRKGYILILL